MATFIYDEGENLGILERLPVALRAVFAAACAERLMSAYVRFNLETGRGDPGTLGGILSRLWEDLAGDRMEDREIERREAESLELHPRDDEGAWVPVQHPAEDAVAALAYALRCRLSGDSREAAWSGRRAFEALYDYVSNTENIDWSGTSEERAPAEARILAHPLVQAELLCQRRDLEDLLESAGADNHELIVRLRDRARRDSRTFLGLNTAKS